MSNFEMPAVDVANIERPTERIQITPEKKQEIKGKIATLKAKGKFMFLPNPQQMVANRITDNSSEVTDDLTWGADEFTPEELSALELEIEKLESLKPMSEDLDDEASGTVWEG